MAFIYAAIDVELADHEKAVAAGSAMYLWTWAMLWLRKQKADGFVPRTNAIRCPWEDAKVNEKAAKRLIDVGLWESAEGGFRVRNYAKKNDSRETIEARIASNRAKQQAFRNRSRASDAPPSSGALSNQEVTGYVTGYERVSPDALADVDVDVGYGSPPVQPPPPSEPSATTAPRIRTVSVSGEPATEPPTTIEITEDVRGQCAMAGAPLPGPEHVVACLANARKKQVRSHDWGSELVAWMIREKSYRRAAGGGGPRDVQPPASPNAPWRNKQPRKPDGDVPENF